jgi:RNA polymerase sigma-70 factor (ECF subfamily)
VTQDVFVRTWQKLHTFRGDAAFSTWLHRLAVNVVIERRRTYAVQRDRMTDDPAALDRITVPAARADLTVTFDQAIEQLPRSLHQAYITAVAESVRPVFVASFIVGLVAFGLAWLVREVPLQYRRRAETEVIATPPVSD